MSTLLKIFPVTKPLPADYEKWLEGYEANGWHLKSVHLLGFLHYFIKDQPKNFRYCYDYQVTKKGDYETIFKDAGWELVAIYFGTYIWRIEYVDERPEAFSDIPSIIGRNNRLLGLILVPFFLSILTVLLNIIGWFEKNPPGFFQSLINIAIILVDLPLILGLMYTNKKIKEKGVK